MWLWILCPIWYFYELVIIKRNWLLNWCLNICNITLWTCNLQAKLKIQVMATVWHKWQCWYIQYIYGYKINFEILGVEPVPGVALCGHQLSVHGQIWFLKLSSIVLHGQLPTPQLDHGRGPDFCVCMANFPDWLVFWNTVMLEKNSKHPVNWKLGVISMGEKTWKFAKFHARKIAGEFAFLEH